MEFTGWTSESDESIINSEEDDYDYISELKTDYKSYKEFICISSNFDSSKNNANTPNKLNSNESNLNKSKEVINESDNGSIEFVGEQRNIIDIEIESDEIQEIPLNSINIKNVKSDNSSRELAIENSNEDSSNESTNSDTIIQSIADLIEDQEIINKSTYDTTKNNICNLAHDLNNSICQDSADLSLKNSEQIQIQSLSNVQNCNETKKSLESSSSKSTKQNKRSNKKLNKSSKKSSNKDILIWSDNKKQTINYINNECWLKCIYPRNDIYIPQINDKIVYLKDAHLHYLQILNDNSQDVIHCNDNLKRFTVENIRYQIYENNYFSILDLVDEDNCKLEIKYTYNGISFLILEELYLKSMKKQWNVGDKFRSLIKRTWWNGVIVNKIKYEDSFKHKHANSFYRCYEIKFDTDDVDYFSPWQLFEIDEKRLPKHHNCGVISNLVELIRNYHFTNEKEWVSNDYQKDCKFIFNEIKTYIEEFLLFNSPIFKLSIENERKIPYPIDISIILKRLNNFYYRRHCAIEFDINYLKVITLDLLKRKNRKEVHFLQLIMTFLKNSLCNNTLINNSKLFKNSKNKNENVNCDKYKNKKRKTTK